MQKITEENYYQDITHISASMIKKYKFCPELFNATYISKEFVKHEKEEKALIIGSAVDVLLTEPENWDKHFVVPSLQITEVVNKKTGEIKKKKGARKANEDGLFIDEKGRHQLTDEDYKMMLACEKEVRRQPLFKEYCQNAETQVIIQTEFDGIKVKGKLDFLNWEKKAIIDLKTCKSVNELEYKSEYKKGSIKEFSYDFQGSWYERLAFAKHNIPEEEQKEWKFYLACVDKKKFCNRFIMLEIPKETLDIAYEEMLGINGDNQKITLLEKMQAGIETGIFSCNNKERKISCFNCEHYRNCQYSLQRKPELIKQ